VHHRSRPAVPIILLACLALGPAILADDVVHFQNGTFMKVQSYTLEGDTIKVTLGPGASMSFPKNLVESIERAGRTVYPQAGSAPANVVVSGSAGGQVTSSQYLQRGVDQVPASARAALGMTSPSADTTTADKDEAARVDRTAFQLGNHGQIRAMGRRAGVIGEGLINKDPTAPPPQQVGRPRGFSSLAPKSMATTPLPPEPEATPPEPAPADPGTPVEDPSAEEDGGN
jgi:hypothetical protein